MGCLRSALSAAHQASMDSSFGRKVHSRIVTPLHILEVIVNIICLRNRAIRLRNQAIHLGLFLTLSIGLVKPTLAQQYLSNLTGQVKDPSGASIANAEVTATNSITKFVNKSVTNNSGGYSIPFLNPGTYTVTVMAQGFSSQSRTGIVLTAGVNEQADFTMQVGGVTDKIVVTADTENLDTGTANLSTTFDTKEVTDLPNVGRNPFVLSTLAAGVTTTQYMQSKASGFTNPFSGTAVFIISNGSSGHDRLTLDGIPDDPAERLSGNNYTGFVPSPEAVQEMKTQTSLYDAQYGNGNGTVLNTVLRTGSNQYHGSAYYVFRNTYLDANTYERVPRQNAAVNPTHRVNDQWSQPGFVLDGPLTIPHVYNGHDKTFFMVAYERIQLHQPVPYDGLVPTAAQRTGDFSSLCSNFVNGVCAPGAGIQIYDPTTLGANNNRTPFLGNIIPASRISQVGAALMKLYPQPNSSLSPVVNYISSDTSSPNKYFSFVTRVDHSFSDRNKMNATFFKAILNQLQPNEGYPTPIAPNGIGYTVYRNNEGGSLDFVSVVTPTLVVDARIGGIYHPFGLVYPGNKFDLSTIGISSSGLQYQSFPGLSFTDSYGGLAPGAGGQISEFTLGDAALLVSKTLQKHSLRVGFEGNLGRYNVQNPQSGFGTFNFNRQFTQKNSVNVAVGSDAASGDPLAAMLLGYPSGGSYGNNIAYALQQKYYALYAQDDWRVTSRLTLNLGFRWDYDSPFTERYNRQNAAFCTTCVNPLQSSVSGLDLKGGLTFVSSSNRFPYPQDLDNFQPRFGAEYQLNERMVLRGGFGIIYFNTLENPLGQGFSASTGYVATLDSTHPANSLSAPFPTGTNLPTGSSLGLLTQVGQSVYFPDPNHKQPYITQYSVSLQTQLANDTVLQIAYVGNKASQLETSKQIDPIPAQYYNQGAAGVSYLQGQVPNPMAGLIPGSSLNAPTIQRQFLLKPYPEFTYVQDNYASYGSALYNSLQITVTKRMNHNLSVSGNFTWSRTMDQNTYLNPQDNLNQPFRYMDPNSTLVGNLVGIYELPRLAGRPALERETLGGWQMNTVLRAQNGNLVNNPGNVTPLSNPRLANPTYHRSFNTCYLNAAGVPVQSTPNAPACDSLSPTPAYQQHLAFTLNNNGPYMGSVRQVIHPLLDLSLFKQFKIHESANFEIRGEFFNVLNTPNFGGPGTGLGSSNFGVVTLTQANDPRLTQLTARINF